MFNFWFLKMLRPIATLDLPSTVIVELHKKGFLYVEDLLNNAEHLKKFNLTKSQIESHINLSEVLALDVWQNDVQRESISLSCSELDVAFENGIPCGSITELSGVPFSGKTQICMQLCVSVQLNKCYGGLNGRAIYIDTRSGTSVMRFRDVTYMYLYYKLHFGKMLLNSSRSYVKLLVKPVKSLIDCLIFISLLYNTLYVNELDSNVKGAKISI